MSREEIDKVLILATGKTGEDLDKVKRDLSELGVVIEVEGESLKYKLDIPDSNFKDHRPSFIFAMGQTRRNNDMLKARYRRVESLI